MESASPLPARSLSTSGETPGHLAGLEKKSAQEAVGVPLGDLSLRSMKEDTSSPGSLREIRLKLSGDSRKARRRPRSLESLCVGNLGRHLEDIHDEVHVFAPACSAPIKASLLAIARRRGLLSDHLLIAPADESWERLDVSGSDVTDVSLHRVAEVCSRLQAVDLRVWSSTALPYTLFDGGKHLYFSPNVFSWAGNINEQWDCPVGVGLHPAKLNRNNETEESWEELYKKPVGKGVQALRWLVWPSIDSKSSERLELECPRVVVNPKPNSKGSQLLSVPWEARPLTVLDALAVEDIDPQTWAVMACNPRIPSRSATSNDCRELSVAERFKLAFVARDERLAPKRAKNMRQNQRRLVKAWLNSDTGAKSRALAGIARKSLKGLDG